MNAFLSRVDRVDSNLQRKSKKVRVIRNSKKIAGSKEKTVFTAQ